MPESVIHALYLSYDGMTDPLGQSQVIPYLIGLSKQNIRFTLISFEKKEPYARSANIIRSMLEKNNIQWIPLSYTKNPAVLSTVYDVWRLKRSVHRIIKKERIDVIHCRSYITSLVGLWAKKKWNVKFIFDMRGLWADERVDGKLWNLNNPVYQFVYRYFKKKELEFLLRADHTISLTHAAKEEILSWKSLKNKQIPFEVIPCCVDLDLFDPKKIDATEMDAWRIKLGIHSSTFVLSYLGSIGTWYMLDEMLLFFKKLREKLPDSKFIFITRDESEKILERAKALRVEPDIIIQPAERAEIPALIMLSRLSVFFIVPAYSKKASSPTKQGEIMAMGIPVVCNNFIGDTDLILKKYDSGFVIENWDVDACIETITRKERIFDSENIIAGARDYFSLKSGIDKYAAVYRKVLL